MEKPIKVPAISSRPLTLFKISLIQRILLKDAMGNTSDIRLSEYRFNTGVSDDIFNEKTGDLPGGHPKAPGEH